MPLGVTSIDGLISGLDTSKLIAALSGVQRKPITLLSNRITQRSQDLKAYQSLSDLVANLRSAAGALTGSVLQARSVSLSDSAAAVVTAGSGAAVGSYSLTIKHLAQAQKISSGAVADSTAALGFTGDIKLNGRTITLKATDSLSSLRDTINGAGAGVSASIVTVASDDHRLILRSLKTGCDNAINLGEGSGGDLLHELGLLDGITVAKHALTNGMASDYLSASNTIIGNVLGLTAPPAGEISINGVAIAVDLAHDSLQQVADRINAAATGAQAAVTSTTVAGKTQYRLELTGDGAPTLTDDKRVLQALGVLKQGMGKELEAACNAELELDGYTITRATNSLDDALEGVSLDLYKADANKPLMLSVTANPQSAVTAIQQIVDSYNGVMQIINAGQSFDTTNNTGGVFFSDPSILALQTGLSQQALSPVQSLGGNLVAMSQMGLSTDRYGMLALDTNKLRAALENDPASVERLLMTQGRSTNAEVKYVSAGRSTADSGSGGYAVQISQVATKAEATSVQLAGGIMSSEALTINGQYTVLLEAGMSLQQAADKLNQVLQGNRLPLQASVADGQLQLKSTLYGSNYGFSVSSTLARGAGGTDLGGNSAGVSQSYYGQNVEGTIGGYKAVGWGQYLTGSEGPVKDLKLQITSVSPGEQGEVKVSQGFASRLTNYCTQVTTPTTGLLTRAMQSISKTIETLTSDVERMEKNVAKYEEDLQLKYATVEGVIAKNKTMLQYLTTQISGLQGTKINTSA